MTVAIGMDQQVVVKTLDGSTLWTGTAVPGVLYHMTNNGAATAALAEGVVFDKTASVIPRLETSPPPPTLTGFDLPQLRKLGFVRIANAFEDGFVGVLLEPVAPGKVGLIAGVGSICTAYADGNSISFGGLIGGSATPGRVGPVAGPGQILGTCLKTNSIIPPNTGRIDHVGILVMPR